MSLWMLGSGGRSCECNWVHTYQQRNAIIACSLIHKRKNDSQPEDEHKTYNFDYSTSVYVW